MHKSMVLESQLTRWFLNRNFFLDPDAATTDWHFANVCSKTVRYSSQGRRWFAYANVDFFGASGTPRCFSFPSQLANPPQISRNECARPNWQNCIATNCPQLVNPFAPRSALCFLTACSNSVRGNSCGNCEKMLLNRVMAEPPRMIWSSCRIPNSTYTGLGLLRSINQFPNTSESRFILDKSDYACDLFL